MRYISPFDLLEPGDAQLQGADFRLALRAAREKWTAKLAGKNKLAGVLPGGVELTLFMLNSLLEELRDPTRLEWHQRIAADEKFYRFLVGEGEDYFISLDPQDDFVQYLLPYWTFEMMVRMQIAFRKSDHQRLQRLCSRLAPFPEHQQRFYLEKFRDFLLAYLAEMEKTLSGGFARDNVQLAFGGYLSHDTLLSWNALLPVFEKERFALAQKLVPLFKTCFSSSPEDPFLEKIISAVELLQFDAGEKEKIVSELRQILAREALLHERRNALAAEERKKKEEAERMRAAQRRLLEFNQDSSLGQPKPQSINTLFGMIAIVFLLVLMAVFFPRTQKHDSKFDKLNEMIARNNELIENLKRNTNYSLPQPHQPPLDMFLGYIIKGSLENTTGKNLPASTRPQTGSDPYSGQYTGKAPDENGDRKIFIRNQSAMDAVIFVYGSGKGNCRYIRSGDTCSIRPGFSGLFQLSIYKGSEWNSLLYLKPKTDPAFTFLYAQTGAMGGFSELPAGKNTFDGDYYFMPVSENNKTTVYTLSIRDRKNSVAPKATRMSSVDVNQWLRETKLK